MSSKPPARSSERHRPEPEIIPPSRGRSRADAMWASVDERATHRIYVARLGPFSIAILLFAIAVLAAVFLVLLIGTVLIWIPLVALLVVAAVISTIWRRAFRR
jgi:hypothetical protein